MKTNASRLSAVATLLVVSTGTMLGQVASPSAGLTVVGVIPVGSWTTTGPTAESVDLSSFNPVTQILYYADHVAHAVVAIDTKTYSVVGWVPVPNCTASSCPSGVQVAPDIQKLIVTDRVSMAYIYDLTLPGAAPAAVPMPTAPDELDYDPIHQRVYIGNTTAPYFLTGVDLTGANANTVTASIPIPGSAEQPRFNPVDGFMYMTIPSVGVLKIDSNGGSAGTGAIVATYTLTGCSGNGNWIDPVTNTMMVGCNNGTATQSKLGEFLVNLVDGTVLSQFPQVNTDDVMGYNPGNRRWYSASSSSTNDGGKCPSSNNGTATGTLFPVVGVYQAGTASAPAGTLVGSQCSGRGGSTLAVDPIHNNVYVPVAQYPADPSGPDTGQAGILVLNDPTPTQPTPAHSQSVMGTLGTVDFAVQGRTMNVAATFFKGVADARTLLVVSTTVGNEVVPCGQLAGRADCAGALIGDPLIGGMTLLANGGTVLAKGTIAVVK
jgi:hypothetical protein